MRTREALCADLDHERERDRVTAAMPEYRPEDLRTVAFQSATGSGKTLLMHANMLQYQHYLDRAGGRLNNVVLVTPNEQMSVQHEREMRDSGLHARLFSRDAPPELFAPVEIIDLNKLAERQGVKRVAVDDFGDDNLVLVDEGHLGATGRGLARATPRAIARRLHVRVLRDVQSGGQRQGSRSAARLRQMPAVRLLVSPLSPGRIRQGLRHPQSARRVGGCWQ